ncbi:unnamed protein product [Phytophthora fragariaefolia]|uniref:Unnamed protein product n=1 Tax=Phytophthora fragariaefolia TaxID=1490495 RepID=A0A9W6XIF0_9STRA|nr:unnamed protein product [Phytophthora fragariaefolia]
MIWALLCVSALALSMVATGLIVFKLYKDWDVRASSVRWLFAVFFTYQFICTTMRLVYFTWLTVVTRNIEEKDDEDLMGEAVVETELYRMGTSAVLKLGQKQNGWITAAIILGDTTHFGVTVWIAALVYELSKLVARSMDRGERHEKAKIRLYSWIGHTSVAVYATVQIVLAIIFTGYSSYAYSLLLVVYLLQITVLVYMVTMVMMLKFKGRNYESVHGHFAQFTQRRECVTVPGGWDLPYINPVFVFTDIESSSALWGVDDCKVMQQATQIHDNILRGLLPTYRGYEITTAGDSFQLAFHTIQEAVEYCSDAQIQLIHAKWPKKLHGLVPATQKVRVGTKTIFRGLRVRMGIHDAVGSEGSLIQNVHAVTGKLTYTGASEVIANEIGDLGAGGQILVTKRVADWLTASSDQLAIKAIVEPVCEYSIPRLNTMLEVFQVVPKPLAMRCESFHSPRHIVKIEREDSRLGTESQSFYTFLQISRGS